MAPDPFVNWDCSRDGHFFEMGSDDCMVPGCDGKADPPEAKVTPPPFDRRTAPQMGGEPPVETEDPWVVLVYLLLRDHVHPGDMEDRICEIEYIRDLAPTTLTNRHLAGYAENIVRRVNGDQ